MSSTGVAVVTGSSRGIGREIARTLAGEGWTVLAGARDPSTVDADVDGLEPIALDVTSDASARAVASRASELGGCRVLVNNAGIMGGTGPVLDQDLEEVADVLATNLVGAWRMLQVLAPQLRDAGPAGRVVNVSSGMGQLSDASTSAGPYRASKASLNMLTVVAANELRDAGVLVNAICPGWVQTDMGGTSAPRSVAEGAGSALWAVRLDDGGPTGGFFRDGTPLDW